MKKLICACLAALCAATLCAAALYTAALGEGIVLRAVSSFAGSDASSEAYVEILKNYEAETGNTVEDVSSNSDEEWKASVLSDFAAGNEPDVMFFFAASADSAYILNRVVPVDEINAAYPALKLPENDALREPDGRVYAIPARPYWEGLFCNLDLFERYDIPLPTDWDSFMSAVSRFREAGVTPIAVSLSDIPHYIAEFAIFACASPGEQAARPKASDEVPEAWLDAMALIRELYELGAFPENVLTTTEADASRLFTEKRAAMQFDGSWFAAALSQESMATTVVVPFPTKAGEADGAYIGGVSMGFYLTRRAWNNEVRRDAAVGLLAALTRPDSLRRLGDMQLAGALRDSAEALTAEGNRMVNPVQDAMNKDAREAWLLNCIARVADGTMLPAECWETVMAYHPFEE